MIFQYFAIVTGLEWRIIQVEKVTFSDLFLELWTLAKV